MSFNITCRKCDRLVEYWVVHENMSRRVYHVEVRCHGETDSCTITTDFLELCQGRLHQGHALEGVAFTGEKT